MKKNILAENMRRIGTKNLEEDFPGILPQAVKYTLQGAGVLGAAVKLYIDMYGGKSTEEQKQINMVSRIQTMIQKDTDPEAILRYMKSIDPQIDDATGIEIMKVLGKQLGLYVDPDNESDSTPLT